MGRITRTGIAGQEKIGNVTADSSTLTTTVLNSDLTLDPDGTGSVIVGSDLILADQADLRLREAAANGTNYIAMQAAATMSANYTLTWPATVSGTNGFVLSSDTSGALSWTSAGGNIAVADSGSTATVHYPLFGTNSGSLPSTLDPKVRSNLSFVPSTGELIATLGSFANVIGSSSNSGTVTIRGTSSATKATATNRIRDIEK